MFLIPDVKQGPTGGIMNITRHCALARHLGADAVLATDSGRNSGNRRWFRSDAPCIRWDERASDDTCVIPDVYTGRVAEVMGPCIVYMQSPLWLRRDFDHTRRDLQIWTDSPLMLSKCRELYPGKDIPIVPNIVDDRTFPFIPQTQREPGMIIVFPRKGKEFIDAVFREYRRSGGRYWKPKTLDGLPFDRMAKVFRRAQAFFASADVEGCALPPQESMAGGVVVIGKDAGGANFCMRHGETALVADDVSGAVECLRQAEDAGLRERLSSNAYAFIQRYFPDEEPTRFWRSILQDGRRDTGEASPASPPPINP